MKYLKNTIDLDQKKYNKINLTDALVHMKNVRLAEEQVLGKQVPIFKLAGPT